jgi:type I restriction enzyme, S subunit
LGDVPEHWEEKRVKDIATLERGKFTHRPRNDPQMYDGVHPFIQTGDVARAIKYITVYKQTLSDRGTTVSKLVSLIFRQRFETVMLSMVAL